MTVGIPCEKKQKTLRNFVIRSRYSSVADDVLHRADVDGEFLMFQHADVRRQIQKQGPKLRAPPSSSSSSLSGWWPPGGDLLRSVLPAALVEQWDRWLHLLESTDDVLEYFAQQAEFGDAVAQFKLGLVQCVGVSVLRVVGFPAAPFLWGGGGA